MTNQQNLAPDKNAAALPPTRTDSESAAQPSKEGCRRLSFVRLFNNRPRTAGSHHQASRVFLKDT